MHCPGVVNPADIPSRGLSLHEPQVLQSWLCGPEFLLKEEKDWPQVKNVKLPLATKEVSVSRNQVNVVATDEKIGLNVIIDCKRYGNLLKLLRVTCYVLRFIEKMKAKIMKCTVVFSPQITTMGSK